MRQRGFGALSLLTLGVTGVLHASCSSPAHPSRTPEPTFEEAPSGAPPAGAVEKKEEPESRPEEIPRFCEDEPDSGPEAAFDDPRLGCRVALGDWDGVVELARGRLTYGFGPECGELEVSACQLACQRDELSACVSLVNASMRGVKLDLSDAARGVAQGCSLDDANSCLAISNIWLLGLGEATASRSQAFVHREHACRLGQGAACAMLGHMYKNGGDGIEQDVERGFGLLRRGCQMGSIAACNDYGWAMVSESWGKPFEPERAISLFKFACERGHAYGCGSLGEAFEKGWGVPIDLRLAERFWSLQCDHHAHPEACAAAERLASGGLDRRERATSTPK